MTGINEVILKVQNLDKHLVFCKADFVFTQPYFFYFNLYPCFTLNLSDFI